MLSDAARDTIQRWVAAKFDLTADQIIATPWYFKSHGPTLADYHGVYVWRLGRTLIVSAPPDAIDAMLGALGGNQPVGMIYAPDSHDPFDAVGEAGFWLVLLGDQVERIVGPSYQGFVDADHFQPADENGARALTAADQPLLQRFMAACPPDAWQDSAIAPDHEPLIGLERDDELIALASAPLDGSADVGVRSVGVVTLPAWRGRGAGLAVVSALTARCLEQDMARGAVLHYQTLRANLPAVAIARRLGYEDVATALAIRLR